jgi:hypothetical protein
MLFVVENSSYLKKPGSILPDKEYYFPADKRERNFFSSIITTVAPDQDARPHKTTVSAISKRKRIEANSVRALARIDIHICAHAVSIE